jgi:hypothetical protein
LLVALALSCAGLAAALLLRWTGDAVLPFLAAVFVSAWFYGLEGGLTAIAFSSVFALLITVEATPRGWVQVAELVALGVGISMLIDRAHGRVFAFSPCWRASATP